MARLLLVFEGVCVAALSTGVAAYSWPAGLIVAGVAGIALVEINT